MILPLLPLLPLLLLCKVAAELFIDAPHFIEVEEDTSKIIRPAIEIVDDSGEDDVSISQLSIGIGCTGGFVSLPPSPKLSVSPPNESHALQANGTIDALNTALAQATYTSPRDNEVSRSPQIESKNPNLQVCTVFVEESTSDDGGYRAMDKATFFVDVLPVNDPPTIIVPGIVHRNLQDRGGYTVERIDILTVAEDEPLSIDMFISDVDIHPHDPSDTSFFAVDLQASHGSSVTLRRTDGLYFSQGADSSNAMKFRGTLSSINNALRGLHFVGAKDYYGNVTLAVQVWDEGNFGRGGELSETLVLPISVLSVDDPPMISIPSSYVVCGEETLCTIPGVQIQDPDASSGSFVIIKASVELGRIDVMRTGIPSSVSMENSDDRSLMVQGTFVDVNKMLASLAYHGIARTHSRVDTIRLNFFEADVSNGGEEEMMSMPSASASINLLLKDTANNGPSIDYDGAIYRHDASCSASTNAGHSPESASIPSTNLTSLLIDEGMCNRLVETGPFVCTEDQWCHLSGIRVVDVDSDVLRVQMAVSHGALDIPEDFRAGLTINAGRFSASLYTLVTKGAQAYVNSALSALSYNSKRNYNGMDSLVVTVTDGDGDSSQMDSMVIPITVAPADDLPKITGPDDVLHVEEEGFVAVAVKLTDVDGSAFGPIDLEISSKYGVIGFDVANQEDVLEVNGTVAERDTTTAHRWYSSVVIRGNVNDLNLVARSLVFSPDINFNTENSGYASVSMVLFSDSYRIDSAGYLIRVDSVNDAPLVSIGPKMISNSNQTAVSILEDTYLNLEAKVSDVDDKQLSVNLMSNNGSMRVFKKTRTCFSCDDLDDVLVGITEDGRTIQMGGTIDSLNSKLCDIRFIPDEDYSGEASVRISVTDDHGARDSAEQLITVIPTSDSFELWMPASASSGFVPEVEIAEGEQMLIGAAWYHPHFLLALHSLSQDPIDGRSQIFSPLSPSEYLETPQAFALIDKEEAASSSSFCAEMQVGIGSIFLDNHNLSPNLEAEASSDNTALKFIGNIDDVNVAARHIVFAADTQESGYTSMNITICEGSCRWTSVRPPSRGCVEGAINIHVEPLNSPPKITIHDEQYQPTKVSLNSKEVPIASIVIDDPDLTDGMLVDSDQRDNAGLLTVVLRASAGTVSVKSLDGLSFLRGTGVSNHFLVFMGQLKDVNHALDTLYFTCFEGIYGCAEGKASVEVTVDDNGYTGKGGPLSAEAVIALNVVAVAEGM